MSFRTNQMQFWSSRQKELFYELEAKTKTCIYCDVVLTKENRSVDHKIPKIMGGTNQLENLEFICMPCNEKKADRTRDEYLMIVVNHRS